MKQFTILFFGDIVGKIGRTALTKVLPDMKRRFSPDLTIANVENLTHGAGIGPKQLQELADAGVDAFTSGNHVWDNPDGLPLMDDDAWSARLIRPANMRRGDPGRGSVIYKTTTGTKILLVNLMGQVLYPETIEPPFLALDTLLAAHQADEPDLVFVDFHAETTAEKEAMGHYADGRVAALVGSHTHVPTADAKILPGGTAYCTDVGRVGGYDTVIGFEKQSVVKRFLMGGTLSYDIPTHGLAEVNGIVIHADLDTGLTVGLDRIREIVEC
ncbi:MAG TPA: TIGR00282 family metallophosphoesterase [Candidatus Methylomirabilis sp.]|nr:TIGR00282 family metallophosphoesterase [Candidatus Methylomirabilis sp.]